MDISIKGMALIIAIFGVKSFIFGIIAENTKPESGNPKVMNGYVICEYPHDPTVTLGFLSLTSLVLSLTFEIFSQFYPYNGQSVPFNSLFRSTTFYIFFVIAMIVSLLSGGLILWATSSELYHLVNTKHYKMYTTCPTAKTGLFGGAAFMAFNATLFWLVCLILTHIVRRDYLAETKEEEGRKGEYGQVVTIDYNGINGQFKD